MLENRLIEHCAPTLAGIKIANLFNYHFDSEAALSVELLEVNRKLNERDVYVEVLRWTENAALIYTYRKSHLAQTLSRGEIRELLQEFEYLDWGVEACLSHLRKRLGESDCFPHEIGVFLGYPLKDVIGFIKNKGKNCKHCGMWKVYSDENEAIKLFEKLKKCTAVYLRVFAEGRSIAQMTVSSHSA